MVQRPVYLPLTALLGATLLVACTPDAQLGPYERARSVNVAGHVSKTFEPHPVVLDDPLGIDTAKLFFPRSETLVLSDDTQEAQLRAASIAVTSHAPMLVYDGSRHAEYVSLIADMHTVTVLTVGDVAMAPTSGAVRIRRDPGGMRALGEMTSLRFTERTIQDPADSARAVADLNGNNPTWLRAAWADPVSKPGAQAQPFPVQSRRDAHMSPKVVATWQSSIPAIATARSYGAEVTMVPLPDPRKSEATLFAMAGLSDKSLIALGDQFGSSAELAFRIRQAERNR
ncbi:hypothetical protein CYJ45_00410 [Corynebacterium coyleae]|nr:hypothetical protein CYJ45_00410 [Corynebacterium coyleae]